VRVSVHGKMFEGEGSNFQQAKKQAAKAAYEYLNKG
ncbi:MAG: hypothetical protein K2O81_01930, partial [Clostridia bacterium]|nr:hypothetical protein [Clostridia bacterium]